MDTSRRTFVKAGLATGATATVLGLSTGPAAAADPLLATAARLPRNPFTLGVASGDPWPDGFVIWTRLALDPLNESGLGGMPSKDIQVQYQIAHDPRFRRVVRRGTATASHDLAHAVHVEVSGLPAGREYYYRFKARGHQSPTGRALTAPAPGSMPGALSMSFVSCAQFEHGWFTAYRRLAEDRPDLVLHLGDYQYEYKAGVYVAPSGNVRDHAGPETTDLAGYRQRHAQYKSDPDLQAAHAVAPWLAVWDDHELDNNWADEIPEKAESGFLERRAAAFRAYYENMPLRVSSRPRGIDAQLFRRVSWGDLATFHMLDTRQYRDDQGCGDGYHNCPEATDPNRSITGAAQERWLIDGFDRSRARWDIVGQQVFFAQRNNAAGPDAATSMDAWDGYVASRDRITKGWVDAGVRNPVVLTGDVHAHWASDLKLDYDDPDAAVVGSELVCSSITSTGDGSDSESGSHPWLKWNQHLKFQNSLRGYVNTTITKKSMTAEFRCLPMVSVPGQPTFTRASFVINDRERGLTQVSDHPPVKGLRRAAKSDAERTRETMEQETGAP